MPGAGLDVFDGTIQKTNLILKEIEREMGWENRRDQSYLALRTVLHALRDRLPVQETADFAAQLPLLVKGILFDGWNPAKVPQRADKQEFIEQIRADFFYSMDRSITDLVAVVLQALSHHVSQGQAGDMLSVLPRDIADMIGEMNITHAGGRQR